MTRCVKGPWFHDFPVEDETFAYCEEHGVTLVRNRSSITVDDLDTWLTPCESCLYAALFDGPHQCEGIAAWHVADPEPGASGARPCGCRCRDGGPA